MRIPITELLANVNAPSLSNLSDTKSLRSVFSDAGEILLDGIGDAALELEGPQ